MDISDKIVVGNVIKIENGKVNILMHQNTNMMTYFFNGNTYRGVSVGEYVGIIRGPYTLVAKVENEFLEDKYNDHENQSFEKNRFERYIDVRIVGQFINSAFEAGIKYFPLVYNEVILLNESQVSKIIEGNSYVKDKGQTLLIGETVQENIPYKIKWADIFNTHIGIFGNTGSGKSNTLAKLYTELFKLEPNFLSLKESSKFVFLDFNGEYTGENILSKNKKVINLSTRVNSKDKLKMQEKQFLNIETLSILYSATEKTQRPFLQSALNFYNNSIESGKDLAYFIGAAYYNVFEYNNNKESLSLLKRVLEIIGYENKSTEIYNLLLNSTWFGFKEPTYRTKPPNKDYIYVNNLDSTTKRAYRDEFQNYISNHYLNVSLTLSQKITIIVYLHLIYNLSFNHVQFEHISPLIQRIESNSNFIDKIFEIETEEDSEAETKPEYITVISLRDCNIDAKKIIPLLIAKESYENHKNTNYQHNDNTYHLIIDEAHNILSEQSDREAESWKDYRLSIFEEIIKEGRKFGYYLTVSTQRPYDISPTIMSQIHNFFLHRLVNENDIKMLNNTISTLDQLSKSRIPTLTPGQCIVTGTSFDSPMLIQVNLLEEITERPDSDNSNLFKIWEYKVNNIYFSLHHNQEIIEYIEERIFDFGTELLEADTISDTLDDGENIKDITIDSIVIDNIHWENLSELEDKKYQAQIMFKVTFHAVLLITDRSDYSAPPLEYDIEKDQSLKGNLEFAINDENKVSDINDFYLI